MSTLQLSVVSVCPGWKFSDFLFAVSYSALSTGICSKYSAINFGRLFLKACVNSRMIERKARSGGREICPNQRFPQSFCYTVVPYWTWCLSIEWRSGVRDVSPQLFTRYTKTDRFFWSRFTRGVPKVLLLSWDKTGYFKLYCHHRHINVWVQQSERNKLFWIEVGVWKSSLNRSWRLQGNTAIALTIGRMLTGKELTVCGIARFLCKVNGHDQNHPQVHWYMRAPTEGVCFYNRWALAR